MSLQLWITGNNDPVVNQGLAHVDFNLDYTIKGNGKTGNCINFGVSGNDTVCLNTTIHANEFTITFWYRDPANADVESTRTVIGYNNEFVTTDIDVSEWKFEVIRSTEGCSNLCLYFGNFDYCDIRVYDHIISKRELSIIKSCLIFKHPLSRGSYPQMFDSDSLYGLEDCSGFMHTLTPSADIAYYYWIDQTPVGDGGMKFDGSFYLSFDAMREEAPYTIGTSDITISFWAYLENWRTNTTGKDSILKFESNIKNAYTEISFDNNNILVKTSISQGNDLTASQTFGTPISHLARGWHMFTITRKSTGFVIYIDGKLEYSTSTGNNIDVMLGKGYIAKTVDMSNKYYLLLCDIRMYTSCMDADTVLMHYNERVGMDSIGNLYSYTINPDVTAPNIGFRKNGNINGELTESDNTIKIHPTSVECRNYYEI